MTYVLGSDIAEIERLDLQAKWLEPATRLLLGQAGIAPGMRVLDLGTGLGHVALAAADLVGATGQVVGIDTDRRLLEHAGSRAAGRPLRFVEGDVRTWSDDTAFDVVVGRLILFHMPDPVAVVRHHLAHLRPGGRFVAIDYDIGACRSEPPTPLVDLTVQRMVAAFRSAGAHPTIGTRLALLLAEAGLDHAQSIGVQGYLGPDDPRGPAMLAGVVRSLLPRMIEARIARAEEIGIDSLAQRVGEELRTARAVVVPPTLVGAWAQRPARLLEGTPP